MAPPKFEMVESRSLVVVMPLFVVWLLLVPESGMSPSALSKMPKWGAGANTKDG